jgi:dolichyl-phosphate-mannose--protein O-mannosyl transferase
MNDRRALTIMALVSLASLACYTSVLRLCRQDAQAQLSAEQRRRRRRLAYAAHGLDWLMNLLVATVGVGRMLQADNFGGYKMGRALKAYFIVTGPLPTLGMVVAMITAHRWGERMQREPRLRRIHCLAAIVGYGSWWLSVLPIFVMPFFQVKGKSQAEGALER